MSTEPVPFLAPAKFPLQLGFLVLRFLREFVSLHLEARQVDVHDLDYHYHYY